MSEEATDLGSAAKEAEGEGMVPAGEGTASAAQGAEAAGACPESDAIPEGYTPITQILPDDIVIVGYPKSGITWLQNLIAGVVYGVDPRFAPIALVYELVPDLAYFKYYRRCATPMYFKSHDLRRPQYRRVVYLLRDGRDVMVSYRHYQRALFGVGDDFLNFVSPETEFYPCHWAHHVEAWMLNPYKAHMLVIKYEDLLSEPVTQLQRFCEFAGVSRETAHLAAIAKGTPFISCETRTCVRVLTGPATHFRATSFSSAAARLAVTRTKCRLRFWKDFFNIRARRYPGSVTLQNSFVKTKELPADRSHKCCHF
jgi:Sulfotransferase domain